MKKKLTTVQLTDAEWKTLLEFLEELSDHQSNAGCNDLPKGIQSFFTKAEGERIAMEFAKYNNAEIPNGPDWPLPDYCLLDLLTLKITEQVCPFVK